MPRARAASVRRPRSARKQKGKTELYHDEMKKLMSFLHRGRKYKHGHKWSRAQLLALTPEKLLRYIKMKVYGDEKANPDEDPPVHHRRNAVLYWKKAWSHFMLDNNHQWSEVTRKGNPTRAGSINKLLRAMKRMEVARRGKPSQARRSFVPKEFERLVTLCETHENAEVGPWLSSYVTFQLHMIARLDDTAKFRLPDLKVLQQYPDFGWTAKLCWAKNCDEERDAPTQILLGARNWRYCVLSHLGMWLEFRFEFGDNDGNEYVFGVVDRDDPIRIKESAAYYLRLLMQVEDFELDAADAVDNDRDTGSHSTRKFGVNLGRGGGATRDDVDHRGRWKSRDRQLDTYAETTIPFVDAKVAKILAVGGPVAYFVREDSGITDAWIMDHVVPNMVRGGVPRQVSIVLGRALLWKVWEAANGDIGHSVPQSITARVMAAIRDLGSRNRLEAGTNPVRRASLGVTGIDAELHIFEILGSRGDGSRGNAIEGGADERVRPREHEAELRFLGCEMQRMQRQVADSAEQAARRDAINRQLMAKMSRNISRLAAAPGRRVATEAMVPEAAAEIAPPQAVAPLRAELSARPRTLHDLWVE